MNETASTSMQARAGQTRTARKRRAILDAATTLFLREGYLATSMDQIAAAASVSKQTVYKQFADKQSLFREIVTGTVAEVSDPVAEQVASLRDSDDLDTGLRDLARALLAQVIQPRMMQLRRLVIGEAGRFPELGRLFYDSGPGRTIDTLAATFENLAARGALRLEEPAAGPVAVTLACVWGGDRFGELARFFAGVGGARTHTRTAGQLPVTEVINPGVTQRAAAWAAGNARSCAPTSPTTALARSPASGRPQRMRPRLP